MFCSNCGKQLEDTVKFCDGCGAELNAKVKVDSQAVNTEVAQSDNKVERKIKAKGKFFGGIALISIAFVCLVDVLFFGGKRWMGIDFIDDGVLSVSEFMALYVVLGGIVTGGSILLYKFVKENKKSNK